jgi:hypothetical protein
MPFLPERQPAGLPKYCDFYKGISIFFDLFWYPHTTHYLANETISAGRIGQNAKGKDMSTSGPNKQPFTFIDLVTILAVIATMVVVLAPALVRAGETANRADCVNSLRSLAFLLSASESVADNSLVREEPNSSETASIPIGPFNLVANTYTDVSYSFADNEVFPAGDVWAYTWTYTWVDACFVPDDYTTIQEALDDCSKSEIIVRDGEYSGSLNQNLDFHGRAITLRSENGPASCTIDSEGAQGFIFSSGETRASVVEGFTITGGDDTEGGAIECIRGSSPTIRNCIIRNNEANSGGGIYISDHSSPDVFNCLIAHNTTSGGWGGGIYCDTSSPNIRNCTISSNDAWKGAGIHVTSQSSPNIVDSIFSNNMGNEITVVANSQLSLAFSDIEGGAPEVYVEPGSTLNLGRGNIKSNPRFVSGALGSFYLSQVAAGQGVNSPCLNAGSQSAIAAGLDGHTTRTDHVADSDWVDMGYHYGPVLTRIHCELPENESVIDFVPTFFWEPNGGSNNRYAVDFSLTFGGPWFSTWENLHEQISDSYWEMSPESWDLVPSGNYIYWRVRGADLVAQPPDVIISDEVFWFYKP